MPYLLIIFSLIGLSFTCIILFSLFKIGKKIKSLWPEIRNASRNVDNLPDEEAQSMVDNSRRNSINDDYEIPNDNILFSQGDLARSRLANIIAEE